MLKKSSLLSLGVMLTISMSACSKSTPAPTASLTNTPANSANEPTSSANVDSNLVAQTVFKQNCVSCHGVDLAGGFGPNLQKVGAHLNQQQIVTTITNGKGGMPAFKEKLKPEEIDALAIWLFSMK
ncbi:cytochrome c [Paenibacillus psychroresistens]|uniref:Cytochrome c n=1 Tax=Paenibacillus psychroresistens TaxID=1778678 RepID=A0A6B8RMA2_9BACL|nr:cytochrome c [Paenibacillus psychroresistens]QGQ96478.1 cytochrome c [Paenibacillus psychroresistens]